MENLKFWNSVCVTNPDDTTPVEFGKIKFTAIDAYTQIRSATEQWGMYGKAWGVRVEKYELMIDRLIYTGTFFYPDGGEFAIGSSIKISKEDCVKKVKTDALTKGLSFLGYNADVFLGKFDDNKYVADLKKNGKPPKLTPGQKAQAKRMNDYLCAVTNNKPADLLREHTGKEKFNDLDGEEIKTLWNKVIIEVVEFENKMANNVSDPDQNVEDKIGD